LELIQEFERGITLFPRNEHLHACSVFNPMEADIIAQGKELRCTTGVDQIPHDHISFKRECAEKYDRPLLSQCFVVAVLANKLASNRRGTIATDRFPADNTKSDGRLACMVLTIQGLSPIPVLQDATLRAECRLLLYVGMTSSTLHHLLL
jgi:hypothetical protein